METVMAKILTIVDAGGGRVPFEVVKDGLDYREQRLMIAALRQLKADGVAGKIVRAAKPRPIHEVFRVGAPIPEAPVGEGGD